MSCVDLKEQFLSYVGANFQQSSNWNNSSFMKTSTNALTEIQTLKQKIKEVEISAKKGNRLSRNKQQQSKMLHNVKQSMRACEKDIKLVKAIKIDMKNSDSQFAEKFKNSIIVTLEIRLLGIATKFKELYLLKNAQNPLDAQKQKPKSNTPNLSKSHFLQESQEQIMEEVARNEYKDIQKSIVQISEMYKETMSIVKMHEHLIESIESNIDETQVNVEKGKLNLSEAHRRESKNRSLIIKVFITLYVTVFVYIVILS